MADIDTRLGIDSLSVFGLPPVDHVHLAADLGCGAVSLTLAPWPYNPHGYPVYSLRDDAALRRATVAALAERGVALAIGEVFMLTRRTDWDMVAADLDHWAELGAPRVVTLSMEPDLAWSFDALARLTELAAARGIDTLVEFVAGMPVGSVEKAVAAAAHVDHPGFGILVDAMHVGRSGGTPADLAAIPPGLVRYAQLCDVPAVPTMDFTREAGAERRVPGEGDLPLAEIVAALPRDIPYGLEVPRASLAEQGIGPAERMRPCVAAASRLLAGNEGA